LQHTKAGLLKIKKKDIKIMITPTGGTIELGPKIIDSYWMKTLQINSPGPNDKAIIMASLVPMNSNTGEMFFERETQLVIDDVLTLAQNDMSLANCCNVLFNEISRQAQLRNII
jgi:ATP-dependent protease ClpP protease subunit